MKRLLLLVIILGIASSARTFAGLGNNEKVIAALFGDPIDSGIPDKNGVTTNRYQTADYLILIQFLSHHSLAESYTRKDLHEFSDEELATLLRASNGGQEWKKDPKFPDWERSDHRARAWCETVSGRPTLLIHAK